MKVGYSYLAKQFADPDAILSDIKSLVISGDFTLGKATKEFEEKFAKLIDSKYAIGVNSGTDALFLSLKALGIGSGDEVITTVNTFVATVGAIETSGARTVFVDCNDKYVMDTSQLESAITEKTKAIMPVHYAGQPVNMTEVMAVAKKYNLEVIEDACCAIGASFDEQNCGTIGATGAFSLHPLKNLNVWGDGGVITTSSKEIRDKLHLLRNHGMVDRDHYAEYAYNSRLDSLQAIVGNHLISDVEWITRQRIKHAQKLDFAFKGLSQVITIPPKAVNEKCVYHMYMLLVENRDALNEHLKSKGISSKIHYPIPLHLQQASQHLGYKLGDFPVAESQAKNIITLPIHQHLTADEIDYMIKTVNEFYL